MRTPTHPGIIATTLLAACGLLGPVGGHAADSTEEPRVVPLLARDLPELPGKEAIMLTVEYPPGGFSPPHRHQAHVFVYVLEGSVVMQVDGQEPVTLEAGQTFYENPRDVHRRSANASSTEPAKFVVFMVKDKDKPATSPLGPAH